jgi:ABC-type sugar transport system substrate-binding protein
MREETSLCRISYPPTTTTTNASRLPLLRRQRPGSQQFLEIVQARDNAVSGVLVEPAGRTAFPKVAQAVVKSGIAWVVFNCETDYLTELRSRSAVPVFAVSADNHEVGRIQGRQLAALLPLGGAALYIQGPSLSSVTEQRASGMLETKPGSISIRLLKAANWTEEAGFHAVASWLRLSTSQKEQIQAVQAQNDFLALGARGAMEEQTVAQTKDSKSRVPFLGVDGLPKTGQAWVRQGILAATVVVPPTASNALVAAVQRGQLSAERTLVAPESFPAPGALTPLPRPIIEQPRQSVKRS